MATIKDLKILNISEVDEESSINIILGIRQNRRGRVNKQKSRGKKVVNVGKNSPEKLISGMSPEQLLELSKKLTLATKEYK